MADTRIRFVPKQDGKLWRVYDVFEASYPYQKPGMGKVLQDVKTQAEAQAEADRLNELQLAGKLPKPIGEYSRAHREAREAETEDEE